MNPGQNIIQNAYFVNDIDAAIDRWHALWGIGPFLVRRHIVFERVTYRGVPASIDLSAAFAQAGPVQIELLAQHDESPSAFHDMFAPGTEGLHHVAMMPDNYAQAIAHYTRLGYPVAGEVHSAGGRGAAFIDTRPLLGHMTEIYVPSDGLTQLYRDVAAAAATWDRRQLRIEQSLPR